MSTLLNNYILHFLICSKNRFSGYWKKKLFNKKNVQNRKTAQAYAKVKNKQGEDYSKSTLFGLKHGLERYLNCPPYNRSFSMSSNPAFKMSNSVLNAKIVSLKKQGKENVHKPILETEDLTKLKIVTYWMCPLHLVSLETYGFMCVSPTAKFIFSIQSKCCRRNLNFTQQQCNYSSDHYKIYQQQ